MNYALHLCIYLAIYAIIAMSLNLLVGYCGKLTLAHAAFFGVGSYVYALVSLRLGWEFLPTAALGVMAAALLSLVVSISAWRLKGDLFMLVSLAIQTLLHSLFYNWTTPGKEIGTLANLTNGNAGILGIPQPVLFGHRIGGMVEMAALAVTLAIVVALVVWLLVNSPWGRLLQCMRDDELVTRGLGKNVRVAKVQAFAFACGLVALAGAMYAAYVGYIDPTSATLDDSILMLTMVLVGGVGNFTGPLVGAAILLAIPELLRLLDLPDALVANGRMLLYGLLLVLLMHMRPQGLAGKYRLE